MRTNALESRTPSPRTRAPAGAVDEYAALQIVAIDRLVRCGLEVAGARARLRARARSLAAELDLDDDQIAEAAAPVLATTERALRELQDEFHRLVAKALRLGRHRLGLS
ncbi:MAG: hypothetical protein ACLFXM_13690 [Acidimicrobiia bacterium]